MASFMMSAAVPWMGMFSATRSPKARMLKLEDFELRQGPAAVVEGLHIAVCLGLLHHLGHVPAHAGVGLEIALDILLGLPLGHADVLAREKAEMP